MHLSQQTGRFRGLFCYSTRSGSAGQSMHRILMVNGRLCCPLQQETQLAGVGALRPAGLPLLRTVVHGVCSATSPAMW